MAACGIHAFARLSTPPSDDRSVVLSSFCPEDVKIPGEGKVRKFIWKYGKTL
jgi:hypothetical protein